MKNLQCISNSVDKFWTGRCYYYEKKTVYLYYDNISKVVYLERKSETDVLISNEISLEMEIISELPKFAINTQHSLFTFLKRGLNKHYNLEGCEVILFNKKIEQSLIELNSISVSINFENNRLVFIFYSESYFEDKTKEVIFQLMIQIIKEVQQRGSISD